MLSQIEKGAIDRSFFSLYEVLKIKLEHYSSVFVKAFVNNKRQSLNHFGFKKVSFLEPELRPFASQN